MKISISVLIAFLLFACFATAQKPKNDWEKMNLKGKVRSIRHPKTKLMDVERKNDGRDTGIYIFNKQGNIIEDNFGSFDFKSTYQYDNNNNKIEENRYWSDGRCWAKFFWKYDAKGNLIEMSHCLPDGRILDKNTYKYDDQGNRIEYNEITREGKPYNTWKCTYKYNDNGNRVEENWYKPSGNLSVKSIYKYDSNRNKIEENRYASDGSLNEKFTFKYDNDGNQIDSSRYKSDGSLYEQHICKYDINGNKIEIKYGIQYDKHIYKYEYDKNLNWIKRIEFKDDVPILIIEREIEYFK